MNEQVLARLRSIAQEILPDNITAEPPLIVAQDGLLLSLVNPHGSVQIQGTNVLLGNVINGVEWHDPACRPDGSYAIFLGGPHLVQILTDVVASRTVWYYLDDEKFIASTTQRGLIALLDGFEFDRQVIPWMLATGCLGPSHGWDQRIRRLPGDACLTLDRAAWTISQEVTEPRFDPLPGTDQDHQQRLQAALDESFAHLHLDYSQWVLPLSGGYDSRGIACMLPNRTGLKTITWGNRSALQDPQSDAYVARELAARLNLAHTYLETDMTNSEPVETIFKRFLTCGDGEVDKVSGYIDGFAIWKMLYEQGLRGIIRGDEGFGWVPVGSDLDARLSVGLRLWSDFTNVKDLAEFGIPDQDWPPELDRLPDEPLESWRDRLYQQFRIPVILAALSDLKLAYVEIITPLLGHGIIYATRRLPAHLRTDKKLYKTIVQSISPPVPFATSQSLAERESILRTRPVVEYLRGELSSPQAEAVLPRPFLDYLLSKITVEGETAGLKKKPGAIEALMKMLLPRFVRSRLKRSVVRSQVDFNLLALRAYIIIQMVITLGRSA